jgi:organic radical activating enzyme
MKPFQTVSICPECGKEVVARVFGSTDGVWMTKTCSVHGPFSVLLEKDVAVYDVLRSSTAGIYPGHYVDVTTRCNLSCKYCYFPHVRDAVDPSIEAILEEAAVVRGPYYLVGAEPTLRKDLPELIERLKPYGACGIATNGTGLLDRDYLQAVLLSAGRLSDGRAQIVLAYHRGQNEKTFLKVCDALRELGQGISGPSFVLTKLEDLDWIMPVAEQAKDTATAIRIHIENEMWCAGNQSQVYVSEVLAALRARAKAEGKDFEWLSQSSRTMWNVARYGDMPIVIVRFNNRFDIDLVNVAIPPTYRAANGEVVHVIYGYIINGIMQRGWLKGRRLESLAQ